MLRTQAPTADLCQGYVLRGRQRVALGMNGEPVNAQLRTVRVVMQRDLARRWLRDDPYGPLRWTLDDPQVSICGVPIAFDEALGPDEIELHYA